MLGVDRDAGRRGHRRGRPRRPPRPGRRPALRRPAQPGQPRRRAARHARPAGARRADRRPRPGAAPRPVGRCSTGSPTRGAAVLVSSHVMDEAERCDRLLLMREGRIIADGTPDEIRRSDRHRRHRAGLPRASSRRPGRCGDERRASPSPSPAACSPSPPRPPHAGHAAGRPVRADQPAVVDVRRPARRPLRPLRAGRCSAMFPFIVMFLVTQRDDAARALVRHPRAAAHDADGQARLPARLRARLRRCSPRCSRRSRSAVSVGLLGLDVDGPVWLLGVVAVVDAVLGTALGLLVERLRDDRVPGGAVHAGLRAARRSCSAGSSCRATAMPGVLEAISNVLPLSYAVDAMQELVGAADTGECGARRDRAGSPGRSRAGAGRSAPDALRRRTPCAETRSVSGARRPAARRPSACLSRRCRSRRRRPAAPERLNSHAPREQTAYIPVSMTTSTIDAAASSAATRTIGDDARDDRGRRGGAEGEHHAAGAEPGRHGDDQQDRRRRAEVEPVAVAVADDAEGPDAEQEEQDGAERDGRARGRSGWWRSWATGGSRADDARRTPTPEGWRSCEGSVEDRRSLAAMSLLRQPILLLARSQEVKKLVCDACRSRAASSPATSRARPPPTPSAPRQAWSTTACASTLDYLGEDTPDAGPGRRHRRRLHGRCSPTLAASGPRRGTPRSSVKLSARRPGAARQTATRSRWRTPATSAAPPATPAPRSPSTWRTTPPPTRRSAILRELRKDFPETGAVLQAYCTAPRPTAAPGLRGLAGAAVQGRLQGARVGRLPGPHRRRQVLRPLPQGADGRPGLPDDRHPRPADDPDRLRRSPAATAAAPGTYEFQMLYGIRPEEQKRLAAAGETMRVYVPYGDRVVRLPDAPAGRAAAEPRLLRSRSLISQEVAGAPRRPRQWTPPQRCAMSTAIIGAGVMGETLLSGLVRAGRRVDQLMVGEKRAERAARARGALRRRRRLQRRGGRQGRHRRAGRQAAGHGRPARRDRARRCAPASCSCRWPPASPRRSSSRACPRASRSSGSCPTPRRSSTRGWPPSRPARTATRRTWPRPSRCWPRPARSARPREAAGRGHRDLRLRARPTSSSSSSR